jgi:hypothetical protein
MYRPSLLTLGLLAGCFNPDLTNVVYKCTVEKPDCPAGLTCTDGLCRPTDGGSGTDDGGTGDMSMPSGCTGGGGIALGPRAYACPGTFSQGQAAGRCASGWQLCTDGSLVDQTACNDASNQKIQGFYVAEVPARKGVLEAPNFVTCGQSDLNMDQRLFFGCGKTSTNILTGNCGGFTRAVYCYMNSNWQCGAGTSPPQTLANVSNAGAGEGVLCCR